MNAPAGTDESRRLAALHRYEVLDTPPDAAFDDLTLLAAQICRAPGALISLVDAERLWFKSRVGIPCTEIPREHSFCAHTTLDRDHVTEVYDAQADPRFAQNPLVASAPYFRFYAGVPLVTSDGHTLGTLSVLDCAPRQLSPEQKAALRVLGRHTMAQLDLHRRARELQHEVVERRHSELTISEAHQFFQSALDALSAHIAILDESGVILSVNAAWNRFGRANAHTTAAFSVGVNYLAICDRGQGEYAEEAPVVARGIRAVLAGETEEFQLEYPCHSESEHRWFTVRVTRFGPEGARRIVVAHENITERKRAHEQVVGERARFQLILESVPVGISLVTDGGRDCDLASSKLFVNSAHERITGVSAANSDLPGVFMRASHPDDYRRQRELMQPFVCGAVDHVSLEKRYLHPDGRAVWVAFTSRRVVDVTKGVTHWVTTLVDITDRKRAQEEVACERARFKMIFESVPVGISFMHPDDDQTSLVNPAHVRITGLSMTDLRHKEAFDRVTHPDDLDRQRVLTRKYKRGEIDHFTLEKRYLHLDGKVVWALLTRRMFADPETGAKQSITTLVDITARKAAEDRLADMHKQLLDISRQAGMAEVATSVLHNVGNVLNSVNVSATLVNDRLRKGRTASFAKVVALFQEHAVDLPGFFARDPRGAQLPGYLEQFGQHLAEEQQVLLGEMVSLRKNIDHIREIVAMQQNYAKVSGVKERVRPIEMFEDALSMNAGALDRHGIKVIREFPDVPPIEVEKHKVLQILINFLRNAKYACDDSGRADKHIILRVVPHASRIRFSVIDNGIGITAENLPRIFSHGFTTRRDGHGFGLHSGANAAREMGGTVHVESEGPGRGAVFTLDLPMAPANGADAESVVASAATSS